jgi:1,4-alpha-glucan branching enzyme
MKINGGGEMGILPKGKRIGGSLGKKRESHHERKIEFSFYFPEAKEVFLAGDFNGWNPPSLPLKKNREGAWEARLKLSPGRYEYKIVVDGDWMHDFSCTEMVPNPFGTYNCVLRVE